jgi:hypothetical protein
MGAYDDGEAFADCGLLRDYSNATLDDVYTEHGVSNYGSMTEWGPS